MRHPLIVGLASLLLACADEHDPEHLSTTTQALGETSSLLTSMSPVGYWRLGESSGGVMTDRSGNQVNGVYSGMAPHYYGMKGAIYGDRDTAMFFVARAANAMIPDRKLYSLTRDWDDFAGALETNSWGPAADGDWWTAQVTTSPFHYLTGAIDGNFVAIINPNGSAGTFQQGRATSLLRGEMQIRATWSQARGS